MHLFLECLLLGLVLYLLGSSSPCRLLHSQGMSRPIGTHWILSKTRHGAHMSEGRSVSCSHPSSALFSSPSGVSGHNPCTSAYRCGHSILSSSCSHVGIYCHSLLGCILCCLLCCLLWASLELESHLLRIHAPLRVLSPAAHRSQVTSGSASPWVVVWLLLCSAVACIVAPAGTLAPASPVAKSSAVSPPLQASVDPNRSILGSPNSLDRKAHSDEPSQRTAPAGGRL